MEMASKTAEKKEAGTTPEPELTEEQLQVLDWRQYRFREIGLKAKLADVLAESKVDIWQVKKMMDQGCSNDLILKILIGTEACGIEDPFHDVEWYNNKMGLTPAE